MITVKIKYSELRSITASVIDFVSKEYWWEKDSSLKTEIEADLGISGDDAWELMQKFSKRYTVDLADFRFDKYFTSESANSSFILWIPVYLFFFGIWISKVVITFLVYPFSRKRFSEYSIRPMIDKTGVGTRHGVSLHDNTIETNVGTGHGLSLQTLSPTNMPK